MERILNTMLEMLYDSDGVWITNNSNIEGDQSDFNLYNDKAEKQLILEFKDDTYKIKYSDIITVLFQDHDDMKIFEIKIRNMKTLLLNIMCG